MSLVMTDSDFLLKSPFLSTGKGYLTRITFMDILRLVLMDLDWTRAWQYRVSRLSEAPAVRACPAKSAWAVSDTGEIKLCHYKSGDAQHVSVLWQSREREHDTQTHRMKVWQDGSKCQFESKELKLLRMISKRMLSSLHCYYNLYFKNSALLDTIKQSWNVLHVLGWVDSHTSYSKSPVM